MTTTYRLVRDGKSFTFAIKSRTEASASLGSAANSVSSRSLTASIDSSIID